MSVITATILSIRPTKRMPPQRTRNIAEINSKHSTELSSQYNKPVALKTG